MTELIAHRGLSAHAPENTIAAFHAAARAGFRWIEADVDLTECGTAILMHDHTADRTTTATGPVSEMSFVQLRQHDAGAWFSEEFRGERVPSLLGESGPVREWGLVPWLGQEEQRMGVNLELKLSSPTPARREQLVQSILHAARTLGSRMIISSFDHDLLEQLAHASHGTAQDTAPGTASEESSRRLILAPLFHRGQVADAWQEVAQRLTARFIHPHFEDLTAELVGQVHEEGRRRGHSHEETPCGFGHGSGLGINTYTVNTEQSARTLIEWGVEGICTDLTPEELLG